MAMSRNLSRRLERLEERMIPLTVRRVWRIVTINSDGTTQPTGISIEWHSNSATDRSLGPRRRSMTKTAAALIHIDSRHFSASQARDRRNYDPDDVKGTHFA
jgi:hypothetical protein